MCTPRALFSDFKLAQWQLKLNISKKKIYLKTRSHCPTSTNDTDYNIERPETRYTGQKLGFEAPSMQELETAAQYMYGKKAQTTDHEKKKQQLYFTNRTTFKTN